MVRLIRLLTSCLVLSALIWFAVSVPLGKRTLWGHLLRIASTEEARDLAAGAKDKATDVAKRMRDELKSDTADRHPGRDRSPENHSSRE